MTINRTHRFASLLNSTALNRPLFLLGTASALLGGSSAQAFDANSLPQGATVTGGSATVATSGNTLTVNQSSNRAVIDWRSFNIGANAQANFNQPGKDSIAVNRVNGSTDPSHIDGGLHANGQVWILNPNGVMFGKTARVDAAGVVATTANIDDKAFMAGSNKLRMTGGDTGQVVNEGHITVGQGGLAAFVAPSVRNSGVIRAHVGKVTLAAGDTYTLDLAGDRLVELGLGAGHAVVDQSGKIVNPGGVIDISAKAASQVVDSVINMSGETSASAVKTAGGQIILGGDDINVASTAKTSADGASGGQITAVASKTGNYAGSYSAQGTSGDGGQIETSGKTVHIDSKIAVNTKSDKGKTGNWTLDPTNLDVKAGGSGMISSGANDEQSTIDPSTVVSALNSSNVTLQATNSITITDAINASGNSVAHNLTLADQNADNNLTVNLYAPITLKSGGVLSGQANQVNVYNGASIQNGINVALAGATIDVGAGTYAGFATALGGPVGLTIQTSAGAKIDGTGVTGRILDLRADGTTVSGFTINGSGTGVGISIVGQDLTVKDNTIKNTLTGIQTNTQNAAGNATITGNTITAAYGISLQNTGNTVRDNIVSATTEGVGLSQSANTITGNTFTIGDATGQALDFYGTATASGLTASGNAVNILNGGGTSATIYGGSVQNAITLAGSGGTLNLAAGTYTEALEIDTALTLNGAGRDETIIQPTALLSTGVGHKYDTNAKTSVYVHGASNVTLNGLTIDGNDLGNTGVVFWNNASGTISNARIENSQHFDGAQTGQDLAVDASADHASTLLVNNVQFQNWNKNAIDAVNGNGATTGGGDITLTVTNSTFTGHGTTDVNQQNGIVAWNHAGGTVTANISGSTFTGIGYLGADSSSTDILLIGVQNSTVSNNTLTGTGATSGSNGIAASGTGITISGNTVTGFGWGLDIDDGSPYYGGLTSAVVQNNVVTGNGVALQVGYEAGDTTTVTAHGNDFSGNTHGVELDSTDATADVTGNWWGTTNDTAIAGSMTGVGAGAVNFSSFLASGADTSTATGFQSDFSHLIVTTKGGGSSRINEAISLANTGATIDVLPGSYTEGVTGVDYFGGTGTERFGLLVAKDGITLQGVDATGNVLAIGAAPQATITAAYQSPFSTQNYVSGNGVTITGLKFAAESGVSGGKLLEVIGDAFTLKNSVLDISNSATDVALFIDDGGTSSHPTDVESFTIQNNTINALNNTDTGGGGPIIYIANGAGLNTPTATNRLISGNIINGDATDASAIALEGKVDGYGFLNKSIGLVTIAGNTINGNMPVLVQTADQDAITQNLDAIFRNNTFSAGSVLDYVGNTSTVQTNTTTGPVGIYYAQEIFSTIQGGLSFAGLQAGDTVRVGAGTYQEQVVIDKSVNLVGAGQGQTTIESPDSLTTPSFTKGHTYKAIVLVEGGANANISDLTIDGLSKGDSNGSNGYFVGIGFFNAGGTLDNVHITGIRDSSLDNIQGGIGLAVFNNDNTTHDTTARTVTLQDSTIDNYQKDAVLVRGTNLTANIVGNTITGAGSTAGEAQNGIEFYGDAAGAISGQVTNNTISGISYIAASDYATSIYVLNSANVTVADNTVTGTGSDASYGLAILGSNNITVQNNTFKNLQRGISLYDDLYGVGGSSATFGPNSNISIQGGSLSGNEIGLFTNASAVTGLSVSGVSFAGNGIQFTGSSSDLAGMLANGNTFDKGVYVTGGDTLFSQIQDGIAAASAGGTVNVLNGTYVIASGGANYINVNKSLNLIGQSEAGVIIDARGASTYGLRVSGGDAGISDVTLSNFTLLGVTASNGYGLKAENVSNLVISNVASKGAAKSEFDLNGVVGATLDHLTADGLGTAGNGISLTDSQNITLTNSTTQNNLWGGLALYQGSTYDNRQVTGITVNGSNTFHEANGIYAQDQSSVSDFGTINLNGQGIQYVSTLPIGGSDGTYYDFQKTQQGAIDLAATAAAGVVQGFVNGGVTGNNVFTVGIATNGAAMSVNAALDQATASSIVNVLAGTYAQDVSIAAPRTVNFNGATVNSLSVLAGGGGSVLSGRVAAGSVAAAGAVTLGGDLSLDTSAAHGGITLASVDGAHALTLNAGTGVVQTGDLGAATRLGAVGITAANIILDATNKAASFAFNGNVTLTQASTLIDTVVSNAAAGAITFGKDIFGTTDGAQSLVLNAGTGGSSANGDISLNNAGTMAVRLGSLGVTGDDFTALTVDLGGDYSAKLTGNQVFAADTLNAGGNVTSQVAGDATGHIVAAGNVAMDAGGNVQGTISGSDINLNAGQTVSGTISGNNVTLAAGNDVSGTITGTVLNLSAGNNINGTISGSTVAATAGQNVSGTIVGNDVILTAGQTVSGNVTGKTVSLVGQTVNTQVTADTLNVAAQSGTITGTFTPGNVSSGLTVNGQVTGGDGNTGGNNPGGGNTGGNNPGGGNTGGNNPGGGNTGGNNPGGGETAGGGGDGGNPIYVNGQQLVVENFALPVGTQVDSNGRLTLPAGLALGLLSPGGGPARMIMVSDVQTLGQLLSEGYSAIVIDLKSKKKAPLKLASNN